MEWTSRRGRVYFVRDTVHSLDGEGLGLLGRSFTTGARPPVFAKGPAQRRRDHPTAFFEDNNDLVDVCHRGSILGFAQDACDFSDQVRSQGHGVIYPQEGANVEPQVHAMALDSLGAFGISSLVQFLCRLLDSVGACGNGQGQFAAAALVCAQGGASGRLADRSASSGS